MNRDIIMDFFKRDFEDIKCSKEFYDNLTDEKKNGIIFDIFYNVVEDIDEEYPQLREENEEWYKDYEEEILSLYKKNMK